MASFDYKKEYKELYMPGKKPAIIDIPEMKFIMVRGKGDPNTCESYKNALEVQYGLSYTIKMSKMSGSQPEGYFEYVVPPLEGLWWTEGEIYDGIKVKDKSKFCWISMIRQPDFVTGEVFEWAKVQLLKKKPALDLSEVSLQSWTEGLCAQIMHFGPYDDEPATIDQLNAFIAEQGYELDFQEGREHHEIYLGDPRKTTPEKLKTVIRHPVRRAGNEGNQ